VAYGPIKNLSVTTSVGGDNQSVNWNVSVDPNGKPANVHITDNHGYDQTFTTGVGAWSQGGSRNVGYSANETISVTVSDSGRNTLTGSHGSDTPPPPPTITSWDGGVGKTQPGTCTGSCHTLNFQVHNFPTGKYTWQCLQNSGQVYYSSSATISITDPNQSFSGNALSYCENTNTSTAIRLNGVTSSYTQL